MGYFEIAEVAMRQEMGKDIVAVFVPGSRRGTGIAAHDDLELRIGRIRGEVLVRIDVLVRRMIDRQETDLIEVDGFFERLHEAETQKAGCGLRAAGFRFSALGFRLWASGFRIFAGGWGPRS